MAITTDDLYCQNMKDLQYISIIFFEILGNKTITPEEKIRIEYCVVLMRTIAEKQLYINSMKI